MATTQRRQAPASESCWAALLQCYCFPASIGCWCLAPKARRCIALGDTGAGALSPPAEQLEFEVRLISGEVQASVCLASSETVDAARRLASPHAYARLLLGMCLLEPGSTLAAAGVTNGAVLTLVRAAFSWDSPALGRLVSLTGGRTARRTTSFCYAVIVARSPAARFRVRVLDNTGGWSGGLEIGFVRQRPTDDEMNATTACLPRNASLLPDVYAASFINESDSELRDSGGARWQAKQLLENVREGDVIECSVSDSGKLRLAVQSGDEADERAQELPLSIPPGVELYPVVSLYGKMQALELLDD